MMGRGLGIAGAEEHAPRVASTPMAAPSRMRRRVDEAPRRGPPVRVAGEAGIFNLDTVGFMLRIVDTANLLYEG